MCRCPIGILQQLFDDMILHRIIFLKLCYELRTSVPYDFVYFLDVKNWSFHKFGLKFPNSFSLNADQCEKQLISSISGSGRSQPGQARIKITNIKDMLKSIVVELTNLTTNSSTRRSNDYVLCLEV